MTQMVLVWVCVWLLLWFWISVCVVCSGVSVVTCGVGSGVLDVCGFGSGFVCGWVVLVCVY